MTATMRLQFAPTQGDTLTYVHRDALKRTGSKRSRLLSYDQYSEANWGEYFDGVIVLPVEVPPAHVRPLQTTDASQNR
jgi:hypothetical protein